MKKILLSIVFTLTCCLSFLVSHAQEYYVKVQPAAPVVAKPAAPSPHHVWVAEEWTWRNGAYVHVPGYWTIPPKGRDRWVPGHWKFYRDHGYYWVRGRWVSNGKVY